MVLRRAACAFLRSSRRMEGEYLSQRNEDSELLFGAACAPLALSDGHRPVDSGNVEHFRRPVGPLDLELVDLRRGTQTEVQRHIVLRAIDRPADDVLSLAQLAHGE